VVAGLEEGLALSIPRPTYRLMFAPTPQALADTNTAPGVAAYAARLRAAQNQRPMAPLDRSRRQGP